MSDLDLELLRAWDPDPIAPSPEVREHARARLAAACDGVVTETPTRVRNQFVKRLAAAAIVVAVLVGGAIVWVQRQADDRFSKLETVAVPNDVLGRGEVGHGPVNILVVGSDLRDGSNAEAFGTAADTGPQKSDTMFVLRIDGAHVSGLWLPRDLVTSTGVLLNSTFNHGPAGLIDAIKQDFGVTIDHYVQVDFRSFPKIVDAVGGVSIYSPGHVRDVYSGLDLTGPGCRTLDGMTALAYVRARHLELERDGVWIDASPRADLDRQARQQEFVRALAGRAKVEAGGDPVAAVRLADAVIPALIIDARFSRAEIFGLVRALADVDPASLQLSTVPVQPAPDGAHLVLAEPDAGQALAPYRGEAVPPPAAPSGPTDVPPAAVPEC